MSHWEKLKEKLSELGFHPDPYGNSIFSYKYKDIPVDIMSTEDGPFGPSNKWCKIGFENLWTAKAIEQEIRILSAPCYLATKFEAFKSRGKDYRTSFDIEDIIYILDNRLNIVEEIKNADKRINSFIIEQIKAIIRQDLLSEVLMAHIHPLLIDQRLPLIKEKIAQIVEE